MLQEKGVFVFVLDKIGLITIQFINNFNSCMKVYESLLQILSISQIM